MRFHEFFKILFLAGFCYLAQLCGGGSTRCGVAVALAIYYTTAVDHSRENSIVLNTAQHCSFVISLSLSLSPTCLGSLVCPMLFFCKHLSLEVDKYTQYPIIRNSDQRSALEFLKNYQFPDADRFLILQG